MIEHSRWLPLLGAGLLSACSLQPPTEASIGSCAGALACPACPACPAPPAVPARVNPLEAVDFGVLPGWKDGEQAAAWGAFLSSCQALRWREAWRGVCARATELRAARDEEVRRFIEDNFVPWRLANPDGSTEGIVTGYYEPLVHGSRVRAAPYLYALYAPPEDLLTIDLSNVNPDLRGMRLRGRLDGKRVVPYYTRAEIARGAAPVEGKEIVWVDDPVEAFFLQVQGSGRVQLENGEMLRLGYADQNGHPFQSIGRYLVERGELKLGETSMQAIKSWAAANPKRLEELLNQNPSFVFFRELPLADPFCPYCKNLDRALMREDDITIYTFLYPILRAESPGKARAIWCAPDRAKAYYDFMLNGREPPASGNCTAPVEKWLELGQKIGVRATPTSFATNGQRILGARAQDLVKLISDPK